MQRAPGDRAGICGHTDGMSDARLPSEKELEEFSKLVTEQLAEVQASLELATDDAKPVDLGLSIGRLSRVDALQQQHMAVARRRDLETRRSQLRAALARIEAGSFGECLSCEEPIGLGRLRARPESTLCRDCQQSRGR